MDTFRFIQKLRNYQAFANFENGFSMPIFKIHSNTKPL